MYQLVKFSLIFMFIKLLKTLFRPYSNEFNVQIFKKYFQNLKKLFIRRF